MYQDQIHQFQKMVDMQTFPHLLLVESIGSDIKYIITKFLEKLYGETEPEHKQLEYSAYGKKHYLNMESHAYYRIIKLNRYVHCDQSMMEKLVSDFVESMHMGVFQDNKIEYRTIVVQNVDCLSTVTQASMRRLIEKVHVICRFIFCTSNMSSIIDPLRSRCIILRIPAIPVATQKRIISLVTDNDDPIIDSDNVSENILITKLKQQNGNCPELPWLGIIDKITTWLTTSKKWDPDIIIAHRQNLYAIMRYNITGTKIMKMLFQSLLKKDSDQKRLFKMISMLSELEHQLKTGNKDIFYLESFIINAFHFYQCSSTVENNKS